MSAVRQLTWPSLRGAARGGRWSRAGRAAASGRPPSPAARTASPGPRRPSGSCDEERALALLPARRRAARDARARRRASSRGASSKAVWSWPGRRPSTSSRQYGSSLQASSARPPSRERSTRPNWSCQRADASSRSATRRQTWSSRCSRITARGPRRPSARPRPRGSRARRGASGPRPASARRGRRGRRPTPRSCSSGGRCPEISTSTTSPGFIGREFAGVPVRITSPGSSVISRQRSASWYATGNSRSSAVASCTTSPFRYVRSV